MCTVSSETLEKLKKFRIKKVKENAAIISKIKIIF